jgi:hypothetical protein
MMQETHAAPPLDFDNTDDAEAPTFPNHPFLTEFFFAPARINILTTEQNPKRFIVADQNGTTLFTPIVSYSLEVPHGTEAALAITINPFSITILGEGVNRLNLTANMHDGTQRTISAEWIITEPPALEEPKPEPPKEEDEPLHFVSAVVCEIGQTIIISYYIDGVEQCTTSFTVEIVSGADYLGDIFAMGTREFHFSPNWELLVTHTETGRKTPLTP